MVRRILVAMTVLALPQVALPAPSVTLIHEGKIILGGNEIAPPYSISATDSAIYVNGFRLLPAIPRVNHAPSNVARRPSTSDQRHRDITNQVNSYLSQRAKTPGFQTTAAKEMEDRYNSYPEVERAWWASPRQFLIKWRDMHEPEEILFVRNATASAPSELAEKTLSIITHTLSKGGIVFTGDGYFLCVPPQRVAETSLAMNALRNHQKTVTGSESLESLGIARDLRLPQSLDSLRVGRR